jgi:hypothetical protein
MDDRELDWQAYTKSRTLKLAAPAGMMTASGSLRDACEKSDA